MLYNGTVVKRAIYIPLFNLVAVITKTISLVMRFSCFTLYAFSIFNRPPINNKSITVFLCHSTFNGPLTGKYSLKKFLPLDMQFKLFNPLASRLFFSFIFYKPIVISIVRLFKSRRPLAIFFTVILIHIYSIKRSIFKFLFVIQIRVIHIIEKTFKSRPFLAESYSSPTIKFVIPSFFICTALPHIHPTKIEWTSVSVFITMRKSMQFLWFCTTAIIAITTHKIRLKLFNASTAITLKKPNLIAIRFPNIFDRGQFMSFYTNKLFSDSRINGVFHYATILS